MRARNYNVIGPIRSTTRQGNNMIKIVLIFHRFVAPITTPFLAFVLVSSIIHCVFTLSRHHQRSSSIHTRTPNRTHSFGIVFAPLLSVLRMLFFVFLIICTRANQFSVAIFKIPALAIRFESLQISFSIVLGRLTQCLFVVGRILSSLRNNLISIGEVIEMIFLFPCQSLIRQRGFARVWIDFTPRVISGALAIFTVTLKTIFGTCVLSESISRQITLTTSAANKRGIHSVSLSLYLMMRLASGEIVRCFGSYPSQHPYYNKYQKAVQFIYFRSFIEKAL